MRVLGKISRWIDDDIALSLSKPSRPTFTIISPFRPFAKAMALLLLFVVPLALTADWLSSGEYKFVIAMVASVPTWVLIIIYCVRLARAYVAK